MHDDPTLGSDATTDGVTIPSVGSSGGSSSGDGPGSRIGPYELVRVLGHGGMGVVYLAEQRQPVRRQVALKIIKQGMDTEQVIARFGAERQALALMDHPNIAKVFDAGATDSGRPYFVMELVQGLPITKYCDANRLTIRERLELFIPVCQAIQHAHQKGVIHRDIKPSNVLVATYDGRAVPKVIDFGIAKATGNQLTEETMLTQLGLVVGTLEYMSPEQTTAASQDIDTRSDVYSLGALLYELLTGVTPIGASQLREAALLEVLRKIREDEPPSPSTRLAQSTETLRETGERRRIEPDRLPRLLRGELDWIVMRALEKDRARRYETANGFARDIERYLAGEAVEAGPPSAAYRLKKFANKNRALLATAAAFAALLVLGATVSIWQAVRARRAERVANLERDRASSEAASAKAVTDFLQNSLLSQASAYRQDAEPDPDIRVRTLLDRAAAGIGDQFHGKPAIEADIRGTIGATYHDLGLLPQAAEQYRRQYDLDLRARGPRAPETYEALSNLATSRSDAGKLAEATRMREQALAGLLQSLGPHDSRTVAATRSLGDAYDRQGEFAKAEPLLTKALAEQTSALGPENIATLDTVDSLEELYIDDDSSAQAEKLAADTLDASRRRYGPDHPLTIRASFRLGGIYERIGKYAQSEAVLTAALKGSTRLFGPEHPDTLGIMDMLAQALEDQGKYAEALAMQLKLYETDRRLGPDLPDTITEEAALATMYVHAGDAAKGERFYKDSLERATRVLGPSHPRTLITLSDLAYYYETHHRYAEAIPLEMRGVAASRTTSDFYRNQAVGFVSTLGRDYLAVGQYQLAELRLREALARVMGISPDGWKRYYLESLIGAALIGEKKYAEAEPLVLSGYNGLKKQESSLRDYALPFVKEDGERVVSLYQAWGRPGEAAEWRRKLGEPTAPSRP